MKMEQSSDFRCPSASPSRRSGPPKPPQHCDPDRLPHTSISQKKISGRRPQPGRTHSGAELPIPLELKKKAASRANPACHPDRRERDRAAAEALSLESNLLSP